MRDADNLTNLTHHPFLCHIQNLPVEIQYQIQEITVYAVRPIAIFLAITSFVCNTLVLFTVKRFPHLQHPSVLILCSLSITDLAFALISVTIDVFFLSHPNTCSPPFGEFVTYLNILCYLATISNLFLVSRDRYLAISKPCWYHTYMTRLRAFKRIIFCWLGSAMTTLLCLTFDKTGVGDAPFFVVIHLFYVGCTLGIFSHYILFFIGNRRHARILGRNVRLVVKRERKMSRLVSVILLCFLFTFLPALVSPVILANMGLLPMQRFRTINSVLMTINGVLNPLINFGKNKNMRRALVDMMKCN